MFPFQCFSGCWWIKWCQMYDFVSILVVSENWVYTWILNTEYSPHDTVNCDNDAWFLQGSSKFSLTTITLNKVSNLVGICVRFDMVSWMLCQHCLSFSPSRWHLRVFFELCPRQTAQVLADDQKTKGLNPGWTDTCGSSRIFSAWWFLVSSSLPDVPSVSINLHLSNLDDAQSTVICPVPPRIATAVFLQNIIPSRNNWTYLN